ncbi:SH3 domain-containing protein [Undibacterium sp. CY18W]|uniref:SH3 domain-containing protein n=1 Tax=Undibacterium hunanense TaxID=2762292 RepID=A0ABR6ZKK8_9BURK|nr:SH3 domain-containing protein [Undibacterium hunanense]MBC3916430.1 SH3 domain-containing protein [Undibacterium hunanense]
MKIPILIISMLVAASAGAESAYTQRNTDLRDKAQFDSASLTTLSSQTKVDVLQRSGGWAQVKTANGQSGWVKLLDLRMEATAGASTAAPSNGGSLLGSLATSGRTSNTSTVGTGVKGLDKEDLKRASPNYAELQKMQKFAVDKNSAQAFAQRSKLMASNVDYSGQSAAGKREGN